MTGLTIPRRHTCIECGQTKFVAEFGFQARNKQPFNQCKECKAAIRLGTHLPRLKKTSGLCPLTQKRCSACKVTRSPADFYWRPQRGYAEPRCKFCRSAAHKKYSSTSRAQEARKIVKARLEQRPDWKERQHKWQARYRSGPKYREKLNNPEEQLRRKRRSVINHLRSNFGLEIEDFERMVESQHGLCAICFKPPIHRKRLSVDHDHETGMIRGLLCQLCNYALGHFKDSPEIIESALLYIKKHRQLKLVI